MGENKLGVMPIRRLVLTMSWPMMLSMLIQALYNMVDSHYVSQADPNGFLALSFAYPIQTLMIAICVGTGVGLNTMLSRRLGEQKPKEAAAVAVNGFFAYFLTWLCFLVFGMTVGPRFVGFFTEDAQVAVYGGQYLTIVLCGSLGMCMQFAGERVLQASGHPVGPMVIQGIGAVVNLALDPILIFGWGPVPAFGVKGAAIATITGQFIGMGIGFVLVARNSEVPFSFRGFRPDGTALRDIYRIGVPAMAMQSLSTFMTLGLNKILAFSTVTTRFGNGPVFILGAYFKLQSFLIMPVAGLNNGLTPILSYNYGARYGTRIVAGVRFALKVALLIMLCGVAVFWIAPGFLLSIFHTPPDMLEQGKFALRVIGPSFVFAGVSIILSAMFQAVGCPNFALLLSLTRQIVIPLPVCLVLAVFAPEMIWWCFPLAEGLSCIVAVFLYGYVKKKRIQPLEAHLFPESRVE